MILRLSKKKDMKQLHQYLLQNTDSYNDVLALLILSKTIIYSRKWKLDELITDEMVKDSYYRINYLNDHLVQVELKMVLNLWIYYMGYRFSKLLNLRKDMVSYMLIETMELELQERYKRKALTGIKKL